MALQGHAKNVKIKNKVRQKDKHNGRANSKSELRVLTTEDTEEAQRATE
jgi:hypothetical protein